MMYLLKDDVSVEDYTHLWNGIIIKLISFSLCGAMFSTIWEILRSLSVELCKVVG